MICIQAALVASKFLGATCAVECILDLPTMNIFHGCTPLPVTTVSTRCGRLMSETFSPSRIGGPGHCSTCSSQIRVPCLVCAQTKEERRKEGKRWVWKSPLMAGTRYGRGMSAAPAEGSAKPSKCSAIETSNQSRNKKSAWKATNKEVWTSPYLSHSVFHNTNDQHWKLLSSNMTVSDSHDFVPGTSRCQCTLFSLCFAPGATLRY